MLGPETSVNLSLILSTISAIGVIYAIASGRKNNVEGDTKKAVETATRFTELNVKLDMITQQFSELIRSNEKKNDEIAQLTHKIASLSSKIERLFEYKDELQKRIEKLEGGKNYEDSERVYRDGQRHDEKP